MNALTKFNRGMLKMPFPWQLWVMLLVAAIMFALMFFLHHHDAQVVLGFFLASMALMTLLTSRFGFTRIVGLGHILWAPMLAFLATRLGDISIGSALGIWIGALIVLNGISLVIDAIDVVRYLAGNRQETVPGW